MTVEPRDLQKVRRILNRRKLSVRTVGRRLDWQDVHHADRQYRVERNGGVLPGYSNLTLDELIAIAESIDGPVALAFQ